MKLPADFKEFIEMMIAADVKSAMIGGNAYNPYLNPRSTGDNDFLITNGDENQQRFRNVLTEFGFGSTLPPLGQDILTDNAFSDFLKRWKLLTG